MQIYHFDHVTGQCSAPTGYTFSKTLLNNQYVLNWSLNVTGGTLSVGIAAQTAGWVGFGIAKVSPAVMIPSEAQIGWIDSPNSIHTYRLTDRQPNDFAIIDNIIPLTNTSICQYTSGSSKWTVFTFSRSVVSGTNVISLTGPTPVVVAFGPSIGLVQHNSNDMQGISVDFMTGSITFSGVNPTTQKNLQITHGSLMTFAFGILIPIGMMVARFGKQSIGSSWVIVHLLFQTVAYIIGSSRLKRCSLFSSPILSVLR